MTRATLVLPMAGSGSRFALGGVVLPKPLIPVADAPFFAWALAGLRASARFDQVVCVVQAAHVREHAIDAVIRTVVPDARIVVLDALTSGAAETAYRGVVSAGLDAAALAAPLVIADCDVCVVAPGLEEALATAAATGGGVLTTFPGRGNPAYSYARFDPSGRLVGTVEKVVASEHALAGCYGFSSATDFVTLYDRYQADCPYAETYVSGVYGQIFAQGRPVTLVPSTAHFSFGTPDELAALDRAALRAALGDHGPLAR